MRNCQAPKWRDILEDIWLVLQKLSRSWKTRKDWGKCHRPEKTKDTWQLKAFGIQDLILDQKQDIGDKLVTSKQKCVALVTIVLFH